MALLPPQRRPLVFWTLFLILVCLRQVITSDLGLATAYHAYFDDGLYVSRAYHLLKDGNWGPYDYALFSKLPTFSGIVALARFLGIPYLIFVQFLFVGAVALTVLTLRRMGLSFLSLFIVAAALLFHPFSLNTYWVRVIREPLVVSLFLIFLSTCLGFLDAVNKKSPTTISLIGLCLSFGILFNLREEDFILAFFPVTLSLLVLFLHGRKQWQNVLAILLLPLLCGGAVRAGLGQFNQWHYGSRIIYEMGQGEYPKLLGAIRSIPVDDKPNRYLLYPTSKLVQLSELSPTFRATYPNFSPPQSAPESFSCTQFGICDAVSNSHIFFFLRQALAKNAWSLKEHQEVWRKIRLEISAKIPRTETTLLPSFQIGFLRGFLYELGEAFRLTLFPQFSAARSVPDANGDPLWGFQFQQATLSPYLRFTDWTERWEEASKQAPPLLQERNFALRSWCITFYRSIQPWAMLVGILVLVLNAASLRSPLTSVSLLLILFVLVRVVVLAHVSTFVGTLESRVYAPTHVALLAFVGAWVLGGFQLANRFPFRRLYLQRWVTDQ